MHEHSGLSLSQLTTVKGEHTEINCGAAGPLTEFWGEPLKGTLLASALRFM